jgi:two-component system phosphate regulon response regulator PhoB
MVKQSVLIVEDEADIRELVSYNLLKEGYQVASVASGEEALALIESKPVDMVLLDLMLPGVDGLTVCRRLKSDARTEHIPIVMLTAKGEEPDVVAGLNLGADDYITKPFSPNVLIARVRAILRRSRKIPQTEKREPLLSIHDIMIDTTKHEVTLEGEKLALSVTEFAILEFLARNPGWVFSRNQIIGAVKGEDYPVTERSVDVQILGLRKKLKDKGDYIETVRGIGYRMKEE